MKISEIIDLLQKELEKRGDVEVILRMEGPNVKGPNNHVLLCRLL